MFIYAQNFVYLEFYAFHYKCIPKKNLGSKNKEKSILKFPPSQIVYKNANTNFKFKISINITTYYLCC